MAWPESADAVITTAETQTTNIDAFISDVLAGADVTLIQAISTRPVTFIDDPDWVDPGDGVSTAPLIPDTVEVSVLFASQGVFPAAAADKMVEVKEALGI